MESEKWPKLRQNYSYKKKNYTVSLMQHKVCFEKSVQQQMWVMHNLTMISIPNTLLWTSLVFWIDIFWYTSPKLVVIYNRYIQNRTHPESLIKSLLMVSNFKPRVSIRVAQSSPKYLARIGAAIEQPLPGPIRLRDRLSDEKIYLKLKIKRFNNRVWFYGLYEQ